MKTTEGVTAATNGDQRRGSTAFHLTPSRTRLRSEGLGMGMPWGGMGRYTRVAGKGKNVQETFFFQASPVQAEGIYPQRGEIAEQVGYLKIALLVSHV